MWAWFATLLSIFGAVLCVFKHKGCWYFFLFGSMTWFVLATVNNDEPQQVLWAVFTVVNLLGLYNWEVEDGLGK